MTLKPLTERLEDYLEVIAELIAVDNHAYSKEIAEGLSVKIPSVSGMLRSFENVVHVSIESKNSLDLNTVRNNVKMVRF